MSYSFLLRRGVHAYLVQCTKSHRTDLPFQQMKTLESSAINDGRSMLAMFLAVLYKVEGLETETLKVEFSALMV